MKKIVALLISVLMLFALTACKPSDTGSSNLSSITFSEQTAWDMTKVSEPKAVNGFDTPILIGVGGDTDIIRNKLYYNNKVSDSGYYEYKGTYNGRHYFFGLEDYSEYLICSCDENYEDFKKHYDISEQIWHNATLYNGVFYNWHYNKDILYAYDLETKERSVLIDYSDKNYGLISIVSITDGWIYSRFDIANADVIIGYNIQSGETFEKASPITLTSAVGTDGILYGYGADELKSFDPINDKLTEIEGINTKNEYYGIMADSNGDIWVRDYHEDNKNYTLRKVHDAKSTDSVQSLPFNRIVNGWYYYQYSPDGSKDECLTRLNLTTGRSQYCKNMVVKKYNYYPFPYYWGFTKK